MTVTEGRATTAQFLREEVFPTVWCPGCGIGTVLSSLIEAARSALIGPSGLYVAAGVGCTGKLPDSAAMNTVSVADGFVLRAAVEQKKKNPKTRVVAFTGNADFLLSGGKDLPEAAASECDLLVLYMNNLIYAVGEDSIHPITPFMRPDWSGRHEIPFNLPHMARISGACYVARWTPLRAGWLKHSLIEGWSRPGLTFIEVISPCLIFDVNSGKIRDTVERMEFYSEKEDFRGNEPTKQLDLRCSGKIIIGKFVDSK